MPARQLKEALAGEGVLIRYYATPLLQDTIRISVGRPEDTNILMQALRSAQPEERAR
jgi:histidinol-phosphate aminotransferase